MAAPGRGAEERRDRESSASTRIGGRYRIESTLGRGGMGAVYAVLDESTGCHLALKRLVTPPRLDPAHAALLFRREFHTLATLRHPRIVEAFEFGVDSLGSFYTMELLDGRDLRELAGMPVPEACRLLRDVASALAFLHARSLVHRDLSPRNVRCTTDGQAKLIDFGVLATAGIVGEIAGTPPGVPPEALALAPLDHRADLYGLGALAYWLLTGEHAFPARTLADLPRCLRVTPPSPSSLRPAVPEALARLVLSLLRADPMARPESAAEVIDKLGAIGGIGRAPELETARGYLQSARLVGRSGEIEQVRSAVATTRSTGGRTVVVEGPSGMGKSRILRELALEAQIAGLTVCSVDGGGAGKGPWGVLRALVKGLLQAVPDAAAQATRNQLGIMSRAIPELGRNALLAPPGPSSGDPREERAVVQSSLVDWLRSVAREHPLALVVDDVQRSDEASASVLAALGHEASAGPLLVAVAVRLDEPARAPLAIAALRDAGSRIRLHGLDREDVQALARALFGDVPNLARLSAWMHGVADGSPLLCTELARHLVERGHVRYVEGLWVIPHDVRSEDAPQSLSAAMDARIQELPPDARALGQVLAVNGRTATLKTALELGRPLDEARVFAALDELIQEEVLVGTRDAYRFRHDGLHEALLRTLSTEEQKRIHLRIGNAIAANTAIPEELAAELGWHFVRGGEEVRGAHLLERAGRRNYEAHSFQDSVEPLRTALTIYEREGHRKAALVELRFMLVCAGFLGDRELTLEYADETLVTLRRCAGITAAERLGPLLGRHLAFFVGFLGATLAWVGQLHRGGQPNPIAAFRMYVIASMFTAAVALASFDLKRLNDLVDQMRPLAILRGVQVLHGSYIQILSLRDVWVARFAEARDLSREVLRDLQYDRVLPEPTRRLARGGALFVIALSNLMDEASPEALKEISELENLGVKTWQIGATQLRMTYHALRGEEEKARQIRALADDLLVQAGSAWQMEVWVPPILAFAYSQSRDVMGMKRTLEQTTRLEAAGFPFSRTSEWLRSEYHRERGELERALEASDRAMAFTTEVDMVWHPIMASRADILLASGDLEGARTAAVECIRVAREPGRRRLGLIARSERTLALVEASTGDGLAASERLERLIDEAALTQNPVILGGLHETAARVALIAGRLAPYAAHCKKAEEWYRPTQNPVLIGRSERLAESGKATSGSSADAPPGPHGLTLDAVTEVDGGNVLATTVRATLAACRGRAERAARAHELLLQATGAATGYLYVNAESGLELVAPLDGAEPPETLPRALTALQLAEVDRDTTKVTADPEGNDTETVVGAAAAGFEPLLLSLTRDGKRILVGAVGIRGDGASPIDPNPRVMEAIAEGLFGAGDVPKPLEEP